MRIAVVTVGTLGDIGPFAALAAELAARGHAVTAISWELHRARLERPGVTFVAAGPPVSASPDDEPPQAARSAAVTSVARAVRTPVTAHRR